MTDKIRPFGGAPYEGKPFNPMALTPEPPSLGIALRTQADADREAALVEALEDILARMAGNGMQDWPVAKKARAALAAYRSRT